jgi:hypothetical protein
VYEGRCCKRLTRSLIARPIYNMSGVKVSVNVIATRCLIIAARRRLYDDLLLFKAIKVVLNDAELW